MLKKERNQT